MEHSKDVVVPDYLHPAFSAKTFHAMKGERFINRMPFDRSRAEPGETLQVKLPRMPEAALIVPESLALIFKIDLTSEKHDNNFLVKNVSRALVEKLSVVFGGEVLNDISNYNIFKTFEDLFLEKEARKHMYLEGIQTEQLCKIRSDSGDKATSGSGVDEDTALNRIYGNSYKIRLDEDLLTGNGCFYPKAFTDNLIFNITLAKAEDVVRGSDPKKLFYRLTNIELEFEYIVSKKLVEEAQFVYSSGRAFGFTHVTFIQNPKLDKSSVSDITVKFPNQMKSLKAAVLLFKDIEPAGEKILKSSFTPISKKPQ